jgi:hypothetical protein
MKYYIKIITILIFFSSATMAHECCYKFLGIMADKSKKTEIKKLKITKKSIKLKISKKNKKDSISKLLKHTKIKKTLKDTTLYGIGTQYKLSKKVKLSIDILAEVDTKEGESISIKEKSAEFKVALSL